MSDTNSFSATRARKKCGNFAETTAFEQYGVETSEKGNMHNEHRGRMKLLRGYVSKSSAALNPLTITQLACELSMHEK